MIEQPSIRPPDLLETFGLRPLGKALREARLAVFGDGLSPPTRWGLSTLRQYKPSTSVQLWLGRKPRGRHAIITNLFNHRRPPENEGWSVRVTNVEDFRGRQLTYDAHNGTDFSIPVGSLVVAPAPGRVVRVSSEFQRGGLKVFIDHGRGLMTTSGHLSRALVQVGQPVQRGETIALSGYSGIDALLAFPFSAPHIHFNTWLNGRTVDPFSSTPDLPSLWNNPNAPTPASGTALGEVAFEETRWNEGAVAQAIENMRHEGFKADVLSGTTLAARAGNLLFYMNYYPWLFRERPLLYEREFAREPRLDLPLSASQFDDAVFYDS